MAHFDTSGLQPAADRLIEQGIDVLRLGYADIIGTDRGRDVLVNRMARTVSSGVAFCRSVYGVEWLARRFSDTEATLVRHREIDARGPR